MNVNVSIRLLTEKDVSIYRDLRLKSFEEAPLSFSESYEDEIKRTESDFIDELKTIGKPLEWFVLGVFSEMGDLFGFVKFRRDLRLKARHKSMIHAMYVDVGYRKQGIAQKLISELLKRIKIIKGLEQIHLWVLHSDNSAAGFYRKCGFESQGTLVKKDLKINDIYVDAEYMVMYLDVKKS
jgi:ribosomal protein S18 acetylase RimI-like enzyme